MQGSWSALLDDFRTLQGLEIPLGFLSASLKDLDRRVAVTASPGASAFSRKIASVNGTDAEPGSLASRDRAPRRAR